MTAVLNTVDDELQAEFLIARHALTEARLHCYHRDSPENRAALAEARAEVDAVLDMANESYHRS